MKKSFIIKFFIIILNIIIIFSLVGCTKENLVTIHFIDGNDKYDVNIIKNYSITDDFIPCQYLGLYYDKEYQNEYNHEPITKECTIYIKEVEKVTIDFVFNDNHYPVRVPVGTELSEDLIPNFGPNYDYDCYHMFEDENFTDPYFLYFHYPLTFDETIYVQGVYADDPNISDEEMIENAKKYVYRYIECDENIGRVFYSGFYGRYDDCIILCYYITHRDYLWPFGWSDDEGDAYTIVYKDKYLWVSYNAFHLGIISKDVYETYIYLNQTYGFPPHHKPI